ncbi:hypothetical protein ABMC89_13460 [Sulfitobacter sp. HNIBRBA3233]|uniref:hypothetical protein n=1 Tax=Sulfitobacter marinivivus TaxID=3158558 RepID=UPI0032DEAB5F
MDVLDPRLIDASAAAACFALTTISFKFGIETGDQRYAALAFLTLAGGYWFMLPLLDNSVAFASVVVSALTQLLALCFAFFWLQEPLTAPKSIGVVFSLAAIIAFSMPSNGNS